MAEAVSPAAGRRYGIARVCRVWGVPRSSFYAARAAATRGPAVAPARPGAGRSRRSPMPICLRPSGRTSRARPGRAKAIASSGRACA